MVSRLLTFASLAGLALGTPVRRDLQLHESRKNTPNGFSLVGPAAPDTTLDLRLALVRGNTAGLIDALYEVSTPSSPSYGEHLTKEEVSMTRLRRKGMTPTDTRCAQVEAFVAPKEESISAVNAWLSENNVQSKPLTSTGDWISISLPVDQANDLFATNFSIFSHASTEQEIVRTLSYSIPTDLVGHLDLVHPTITYASFLRITQYELTVRIYRFPNLFGNKPTVREVPRQDVSERADVCYVDSVYMTPSCLESLYNMPTAPATSDSNQLGVTGYVGEYAKFSDLTVGGNSLAWP